MDILRMILYIGIILFALHRAGVWLFLTGTYLSVGDKQGVIASTIGYIIVLIISAIGWWAVGTYVH